jgi:hypothetical protein
LQLRNKSSRAIKKEIVKEQEVFVTCKCQNCKGNIEFDTSLFQTGTMVTCPHCNTETPLFIPDAPKVSEWKVEKAPEKTATVVKQTAHFGGREDTLDEVGNIVLALGILGGGVAIVAAFVAFNDNETPVGVDLLCVGVIAIFVSMVNRILFRAGAEVIRLLKKMNGLKFSGEISEPKAFNVSKCSACGASVDSFSKRCHSCGLKFKQ